MAAQDLKEAVFNDVIKIGPEHVAASKGNYLVDIAVNPAGDRPVFFLDARIPSGLFKTMYPGLSEFMIISPDWDYYDKVARDAAESGAACLDPVETHIYYTVKREGEEVRVDSVRLQGEQPEIHFKQSPALPENIIGYYFSERYGSICCPRDPLWDLAPSRKEFLDFFEKDRSVKVRGTYVRVEGKEGEQTVYYTLSGLTPAQKLDFIIERRYFLIQDRYLKDLHFEPVIVTPYWMEKAGLRPEQ